MPPPPSPRFCACRCSFCHQRGAAIGCAAPACRRSYHYGCAGVDECILEKDSFQLFCPLHTRNAKAGRSERAKKRDCPSTYARNKTNPVVIIGSNLSVDQKALIESLSSMVRVRFQKQWGPEVSTDACSCARASVSSPVCVLSFRSRTLYALSTRIAW